MHVWGQTEAICNTIFSKTGQHCESLCKYNTAELLHQWPIGGPAPPPMAGECITVSVDQIFSLFGRRSIFGQNGLKLTLLLSQQESREEVFATAVARLANLSMHTGKFPARYKRAQLLPLLKKRGLDISLLANYRPISNLANVSKVTVLMLGFWNASQISG